MAVTMRIVAALLVIAAVWGGKYVVSLIFAPPGSGPAGIPVCCAEVCESATWSDSGSSSPSSPATQPGSLSSSASRLWPATPS